MKIEITVDEMITMLKYFQNSNTVTYGDLAKGIKEELPKKMAEQWTWTTSTQPFITTAEDSHGCSVNIQSGIGRPAWKA